MGLFNKDDNKRGKGSRPGMHQATCSNCGKKCEVPFKPTGDRPIYCSDCFEKKGGKSSSASGNRPHQRRDFDRKQII